MRNVRFAICAALVLSGCGISQEQDISQVSGDSDCKLAYFTVEACYERGVTSKSEHGCESFAVDINKAYEDTLGSSEDDTVKVVCHSACLAGINEVGLSDVSSVCN